MRGPVRTIVRGSCLGRARCMARGGRRRVGASGSLTLKSRASAWNRLNWRWGAEGDRVRHADASGSSNGASVTSPPAERAAELPLPRRPQLLRGALSGGVGWSGHVSPTLASRIVAAVTP